MCLQVLMFLWLVFTAPDLSSRDAFLFRAEGALPQAADSRRLCGATDGVERPGDVTLTAAVLRRRYGFDLASFASASSMSPSAVCIQYYIHTALLCPLLALHVMPIESS